MWHVEYSDAGSRATIGPGFPANQTIVNDNGYMIYTRGAAVSRSDGNVTRSVEATRAKRVLKPQGLGRAFGGGRRP
jgi:hypothetical protein